MNTIEGGEQQSVSDIQKEQQSLSFLLNAIKLDRKIDGGDNEYLNNIISQVDDIQYEKRANLQNIFKESLENGYTVKNEDDYNAFQKMVILSGAEFQIFPDYDDFKVFIKDPVVDSLSLSYEDGIIHVYMNSFKVGISKNLDVKSKLFTIAMDMPRNNNII